MMKIILLIILILINGFFAMSEIAFLSVDQYELKKDIKKKNNKALKIQKLLSNPSSFLALIQIGVTLAGFLASAVAAEHFAEEIALKIYSDDMIISFEIMHNIVLVIITILLSIVTLIFGELVPKRIAIANPKKVSYAVVDILFVFSKIFIPIIWILTKTTDIITSILHIKKEKTNVPSEETLVTMILESEEAGKIEKREGEIITRVFSLNDTKVKDVMTPYKDVVVIEKDAELDKVFKLISEKKYTRIPVYDTNKKNIIGVVHIKDILLHLYEDKENFKFQNIIRKCKRVNEDTIVDDVAILLKNARTHIAIVENANKEMVGIITLEDLLEEIVGEISDEYN